MNINKNGTIIDVRSPQEFADQHFPGAVNIPLDEVLNRINELKKFQKPIVAYCKSGNRSGIAVAILKENGITGVENGGGLEKMLQEKTASS